MLLKLLKCENSTAKEPKKHGQKGEKCRKNYKKKKSFFHGSINFDLGKVLATFWAFLAPFSWFVPLKKAEIRQNFPTWLKIFAQRNFLGGEV